MYCRNCGEKLNDDQAFCVKCGVRVGEGNKFCHNCGNEVDPQAVFCVHCGVEFKKKAQPNNEGEDYLAGQNKTTMALVCFFLGGIGIHNFMMGETKKGIFKIVMSFCCGIGAILALIDFIKILTGSYVVDTEKLV